MPNTPLFSTDLFVDLIIVVIFMVGVSKFRTPSGARLGNTLTSLAFAIAVGLVFLRNDITEPVVVFAGLGIGSLAGWLISARITMTRIPALIAIQNGAGGGASALVSIVELLRSAQSPSTLGTVFGCIGLIVGAVALSGSVLAAAKLENRVSPRPKLLPAHNAILLTLLAAAVALSFATLEVQGVAHVGAVVLIGIAALALGILFAIRIGGADMPVLISFLNTLSGLAAAFVGVSLSNQMLVAAGAMVGSSGLILTWVMCANMNRTLLGVLTGHSVKIKHPEPASCDLPVSDDASNVDLPLEESQPETRAVEPSSTPASPRSAALSKLDSASEVVIVPGYGMAQARAQMEVAALATKLEGEGKRVRFAVHPVAGRMPGHMHVLLAEADVDYDKLFEMDQINDEFASTDVVLVVGACDVVNPAANSCENTPISGMPVLRVEDAGSVIVCNLDAKPGYSGVENPLYEDPKTILLFGDAKETVGDLLKGSTEANGISGIGAEDSAAASEVATVGDGDTQPASHSGTPSEELTDDERYAIAWTTLDSASEVVIVPGYGMAQARAQMEVAALATKLEGEGKRVRFAVHPVAGRMPGHMHVLLAEADVDYDKLFEMDQINDEFASTDVVLVVGACDVVNPAANSCENTPISGMPVLRVEDAGSVIVCNLDAKPGYSGVENPLYEDPKTILLFGDAKETVARLGDDASCAYIPPATNDLALEQELGRPAGDPVTDAASALMKAHSVIIVPGYGMAQARAQMEVAALATKLEGEGKRVRFAVHPVAGRMPGHMHVLLAEADVDYDKLFEMDQINDEFASTDVVLVVGACDVVNPAAIDVADTPISGMPILKAHEAARVIVCNLDAKPGYSGVENPLYDDPKAILLFGDAKETVDAVSCRLN